jgi:adenylate kinase
MGSKKVFIFLGPPGAGKGTQAKMLAKELGIPHVSVGEIIRRRLKEKPDPVLQEVYDKGDLFPAPVVLGWLKERAKDLCCDFVLDGSMRTLFEAEDFSLFLKENDYEMVVLNIHISPEETMKRNLKRARDATDTKKAIVERLEEYEEKSRPALEFLKDKIIEINGEQSIQKVHRDIWSHLGGHP